MLSTSTHVYSHILLHLNWHCKWDRPLIAPAIEPDLFALLRNYCMKSKGVRFHGIGGTETHLHLLVQIEPFVPISTWIGKVKGASTHEMNLRHGKGTLEWQRGFGIVSFAPLNLVAVRNYVDHQKEHHRTGRLNEALEKYGSRADGGEESGEDEGGEGEV